MLTNEQKPTSAKFNDDLAKILSEDRSREAKVQDEKISELSRIMNAPVAPVKQTLTEEHKNLKVTDKTSQVIESIQNKAKPVLNKELLERIPTIQEMFVDFKNVATARSTIINEEFNKYASPDIRFNAQALKEFESAVTQSKKNHVITEEYPAKNDFNTSNIVKKFSTYSFSITYPLSDKFFNLKVIFLYNNENHKIEKLYSIDQIEQGKYYNNILNFFTKEQILDAAFKNREFMDVLYNRMRDQRERSEVPNNNRNLTDRTRIGNIRKSIQDTAK